MTASDVEVGFHVSDEPSNGLARATSSAGRTPCVDRMRESEIVVKALDGISPQRGINVDRERFVRWMSKERLCPL